MKKNIYRIISFTAIALSLAGCIKNDIPYARVVADITAFSVEGQIGEAVIDKDKREVTVTLAETADFRHARITSLEVSNDAKISPVRTHIDFSKPSEFTLTTYQDYVWAIKGVQIVERYVTSNQLVSFEFLPDAATHTGRLVIYVSRSQDLTDINIATLKLGPEGSVISPDFTTVHDFTSPVEFDVSYLVYCDKWTVEVVRSELDVVTGAADDIWAKSAVIRGNYLTSSDDQPGLEYRKEVDSDWIVIAEEEITVEGNNFSANLSGLEPSTVYTYRSTLGDVKAGAKDFTTDTAAQVPNMNFEDWHTVKYGTLNCWYPSLDLEANQWWDSGNRGANVIMEYNPTTKEEDIVVRGNAAKLSSKGVLLGIFAAASIYTGKFLTAVISPRGAELDFGKPYTSRPQKLKGYYRYAPGIIDKTEGDYTSLKDTRDIGSIWVALADWDEPFHMVSSTKVEDQNMLDLENDPSIIAYGVMDVSPEEAMTEYEEFEIELTYRDLQRKPKYVVIVASASKYGDFFTGSSTSVMYVDEFEFVFEK